MQTYNLTFTANATFRGGLFQVIDQITIQTTDVSAGVSTIVALTGTRTLNDLEAFPTSQQITGLAPIGTNGSDNKFFPFGDMALSMPFLTNLGFDYYVNSDPIDGNASSILLRYDNATGAYAENVPGEQEGTLTVASAVCFVQGTRIRTAQGDIAVEELRIGDLAVTASNEIRPITWIGKRTIECSTHPRAGEVLPVRIEAHAFAENRPARDLLVSPGHSIAIDLLGEVLIPASSLINGATIRQESVSRVIYWHVALESHDLLITENLPTESYLDMGNRGFFTRPGEALVLHGVPDAAPTTHAEFCRPFHEAGAVVEFVRSRLAARALQLEWTQVEDAFADLHLVVDGRRVEPEVQGLSARFLVPASTETVWMASDTVVPAIASGGADLRTLGVCVGRLVINDGFGSRSVPVDDPRLGHGFHHVEEGPQRWTAGRAHLPAELWEGCHGSFFLRVDLTRPALPKLCRRTSTASSPGQRSRGEMSRAS